MHQFKLAVPRYCSYQHLLTRVQQSSQGAFYRIKDGWIGRPLIINDQPRIVEISESNDSSAWNIRVHRGTRDEEAALRLQLARIFSFDTDLAQFYSHAEHDPLLQAVCTSFTGARMLRDATVFSSVISSIISQQLNLKFAAELKKRLWELAGTPIAPEDEGGVLYADPSPNAIASLAYNELRQIQYSERKAQYVIDFARAAVNGDFSFDSLDKMDDEEAVAYLSSMRGLGRWTAECVLMFGLARPDLLPAKDVGLQKSVTRLYRLGDRISEDELRQRACPWQPWRSWYTYYLWLALSIPDSELGRFSQINPH